MYHYMFAKQRLFSLGIVAAESRLGVYWILRYKSALNPPVVYSTDRSKAVVTVLIFFFVALWFIPRGDLF